jgi:integrase/recombinase XerD
LNLFRNHVGSNVRVADISIDTISRFMNWLRYERGVPCKPKSYQRRLTTLKVFFAWLMQTGVIPEDPAAPIAHQPVTSPLPAILYPDQVEKLLDASRAMRDADRGDIRPYLLVSLLLATGIKKSEAMAIRLADIDLSGREGVLYIRYEDARKRHKERKLRLPRDFAESYTRYQRQYHPSQKLFECTARNLEYVLADLAKMTGLGETVSFESLRWTCAVRDYTAGMKDDTLRQKLGLSAITWEEAGDRLRRLAAKPL